MIMRNCEVREFGVRVIWPSPMQQVRVPIWSVRTMISGRPTPNKDVMTMISHNRSYSPRRSHPHPQALSFLSSTLPSLQNAMWSHLSLSLHVMSMSWHRVHHTPSTIYPKYSTHWVQPNPCTAYTMYRVHRVQHPPRIMCFPFIPRFTCWPLNGTSASGVPPHTIDHPHPAIPENSKLKSNDTFPGMIVN